MIEDKIKAAIQESFVEGKDEPDGIVYEIMWAALISKLKSILNEKYCLHCGKSTDNSLYCDGCLNMINTCEECGLKVETIGLCDKHNKQQQDFINKYGR